MNSQSDVADMKDLNKDNKQQNIQFKANIDTIK